MFICVTIHKLMSMSVHLLGSVILSPDSASLCLWQLDYQFISKKLIIISFVKSPLLDFDNYSASNYFFHWFIVPSSLRAIKNCPVQLKNVDMSK